MYERYTYWFRCELLSDFVYSFFEHNFCRMITIDRRVVNCFQILYIRSLNTIPAGDNPQGQGLWIAFRFCIFVLWTQYLRENWSSLNSCELLSDFVYSFFEHNNGKRDAVVKLVVNCFQILYIRSLNTMPSEMAPTFGLLWIAFRFCIFVLWTQSRPAMCAARSSCELLSDFVYSFFEHNRPCLMVGDFNVVNCFQILYIRSLNTMAFKAVRYLFWLWIAFRFCIFVLWTQYSNIWKK